MIPTLATILEMDLIHQQKSLEVQPVMALEYQLYRLGISCYLDRLVAAGFDTWANIQDIKETDM